VATKAVAKRFGSVKAAKSALKGNRSNGALKRLNADQTLKVRFMTEPDDWYEAHYHWLGGNFVWCNQQTSCPGCKSGDRPRTLVLANAVIFGSDDERDMNRVVVMQMPPTLANSLLKFHEKRGTILDRDYDLTREGSGQNDTVYSADPDDPKTRKMSRFEKDMHDIEAIINSELGDDEEEDDDEPRATRSKSSSKKSSRRRDDDDDEYEDEDDEDDEDDEEEDERPRRSSRAVAKKKPARRSSHEDEDDEEDEEDEEDERPSKPRKSKYDGLNEFKSKKSGTKTRAVVRRSR
jgi:hypothetical protein